MKKELIDVPDKEWMTILMEKSRMLKMKPDEIIRKVKDFRDYFLSRIIGGHIITYLNGFVGVGVLETPQDHLSKNVNIIWMFGVGFNDDGSDIIENTNIEMTLDEAEDCYDALGICIERYKENREIISDYLTPEQELEFDRCLGEAWEKEKGQ